MLDRREDKTKTAKVWYGTEREGRYKGYKTIFIRGGEEHIEILDRIRKDFSHESEECEQFYLGAGSQRADPREVLRFLGAVDERFPSVGLVTVEITHDDVRSYDYFFDERLHLMVAIRNSGVALGNHISLKYVSDKFLLVGTKYDIVEFVALDTGYEDDVVLF